MYEVMHMGMTNTPLKLSQKYIRFHNIFFETWKDIALPYLENNTHIIL
jgi:hypothetical protein